MASASLWVPFKELASVVNAAVLMKQPDVHYKLEATLKKHKPDFISLLQNPPKNAKHRAEIEAAVKEGVAIPSLPRLPSLPGDLVEEALVLSNILELNEMSAIELLVAGEQQTPRFPGLPRGLVAVLLYHDGRRNIVSTLRCLIQAREGVAWTLGLNTQTTALITSFTDQLFEDGLVGKILSLLDQITVEGELEKLTRGVAVGDAKHRRQLVALIEEQRGCLADSLLYWATQNPFPKQDTLRVMDYLKSVKSKDCGAGDGPKSPPAVITTIQQPSAVAASYQPLEPAVLSLFHTLLACFNIGDYSVDTVDDLDDNYPAMSDSTFVPSVHAKVRNGTEWVWSSLHSAVKFAWGVLLRECSGREAFTGVDELEDDETLVNEAVAMDDALHFLRQCVVASPLFHREEFYVRRIHWLITSFIINMPLKVKELRNQGDEVAREIMMRGGDGGVVSNSRRRGFEEFMKLIGDLHSTDPCGLQLALDFWPTADASSQTSLPNRVPQRHISLYKFVQLCSDLLPAPLFSSFMAMLSGLSSSPLTAHHCFNFLKANSPSLGGGGASAAISLDHFFYTLKQYYLALSKGGGVNATPTGCVITPQELQGLNDVLTLTRIIATHDDAARIVMYDNQTWLPVASLFGLVGCPVPSSLKAEILLTLAAFSRSPEVASSMWHTLEATQILNTSSPSSAPSGGSGLGPHSAQEGNIQVELEEMEAKSEEYPLTRAFLSLLDTLTDVPIPATLGAGHRVPGFEPYLVFLRDTVFLKFDSRAYKQLEEKWEVASLALEVLHKLLVSHDVSPDHFIEQYYQLPGGGSGPVPSPPGHSILLHLMNDSQLLRKLLSVVAHASVELLSSSPPPKNLDRSALLCLKLIETALTKEEVFMAALRQGSQSAMATPLHQLLLGINPHTKSADHLVNVARFVSAEGVCPELALTAVHVLYWVSHSSKAGKDIAKAIASNKDVCAGVLHGFVEHLEWEDSEGSAATEGSVAMVHRDVQLAILRLLSLGLENPSPNLAHLLLGFDEGSETNLQDPGVLDSPRTCLHSILLLVEHGSDPNNPIGRHYSNPKLAELCYRVIYQLAASRELSTPTLRYLRNNHDFFLTQLSKLPFNTAKLSSTEDEYFDEGLLNSHQASLVLQQGWLMKTIAIELRMTSLNHQLSHTQRLVNLLLSEPTNQNGDAAAADMGMSDFKSDFDFLQEGRRKILILLDLIVFDEMDLPTLDLHFFDQQAMEQAIASCDTQEEGSGATFTEVKLLHRMLLGELATLHGAGAAGQKQSVLQEIHGILEVVVARNRVREHCHGYQTLFESWRQLVEVLLHCLSHNSLKQELCVAVLFELVQDLLIKVSSTEGSELAGAVHGVVLVLVSHLRQTVATATVERNESLLTTVFSGPLHGIMRGLMENLLKTPAASQQERSFLYGSLLYYLVLCSRQGGEDGGRKKGPTSLWQSDREANSVVSGNLSALNSFGEPFMDTLCKNACSGHDVARMLSLSLLDAIVSLDWHCHWLRFLTLKGYLQTLCASLQWEDDTLQKVLHSTSEEMRALYIYDSKMAFLTRVASSQHGCRELVSLGSLGYLSQCGFIDMRPSSHGASYHSNGMEDAMGFVPSVVERYRQLFLPVLRFLLAVLMAPGPQQKDACTQATALIATHSDVFAAVLKEQPPVVTMATLQELSLVTAVICHSGVGHDWSPQGITASSSEGSGLVRIQRLMLSLLPHFWSKQNLQKLVEHVLVSERAESGADEDPITVEKASLLTLQITANLVAYCRVAMTMGGVDFSSPSCRIVLTPDLSEALVAVPTADPSHRQRSGFPSLGLLVRFLKECTESYSQSAEDHMTHSRKVENLGKLSSEEIQKLLPNSASEKLSSWQQQALAKRRLLELLSNKKQKLQQCAYIVENLLYVLWRHLQYYLVHCRPLEPEAALGVGGALRQPMRRMQETRQGVAGSLGTSALSDGVTTSELDQLKTGSTRCLTDPLFKKLLDLEEAQLASRIDVRVGFVQALVRRIRRLLKLKAAAPQIIST